MTPQGRNDTRAPTSSDLGFPPEIAESGLELLHGDAFKKGTTQTTPPPPALAASREQVFTQICSKSLHQASRARVAVDLNHRTLRSHRPDQICPEGKAHMAPTQPPGPPCRQGPEAPGPPPRAAALPPTRPRTASTAASRRRRAPTRSEPKRPDPPPKRSAAAPPPRGREEGAAAPWGRRPSIQCHRAVEEAGGPDPCRRAAP